MSFNAVRFGVGRIELDGTLSSTKGFCIPLQFQEDGALIHKVGSMGRSTENCSFKGSECLFVVACGGEDPSKTIVGLRGFWGHVKGKTKRIPHPYVPIPHHTAQPPSHICPRTS